MSKILYCRIPEDLWNALVQESRDTDTPLVRTVVRVLRRGVAAAQVP
jgi:hypothetical protein